MGFGDGVDGCIDFVEVVVFYVLEYGVLGGIECIDVVIVLV